MSNIDPRFNGTKIFDSEVTVPTGIDDAYEIRISVPILILNSGRPYVRSYREFVYRMMPNKSSLTSYYGHTFRFLNYAFYCLKVSKIPDILPHHLKKFIRYQLGAQSNVAAPSYFAAIKVMFDKFKYDGLLDTNPFPEVESIAQLKPRRHESIDSKIASLFVRSDKNDIFEMVDHALRDPVKASTLDLRANALVAALLYANLKIGQAVSLKIEDFRRGKDGQYYIRIWKGQEAYLTKIGNEALTHFDRYEATLHEFGTEVPFFQKFNRGQIATGRSMSTGRARDSIENFCVTHNIRKITPQDITNSRPFAMS